MAAERQLELRTRAACAARCRIRSTRRYARAGGPVLDLKQPAPELLCSRNPLLDVVLERMVNQRGEGGRDVGGGLAERRKAERRLLRGIAAGQAVMHGGAERIEVGAQLDLAAVLLRRRVTLRANHGGVAERLEMARDAEIDQLCLPAHRKHHVARLEVA